MTQALDQDCVEKHQGVWSGHAGCVWAFWPPVQVRLFSLCQHLLISHKTRWAPWHWEIHHDLHSWKQSYCLNFGAWMSGPFPSPFRSPISETTLNVSPFHCCVCLCPFSLSLDNASNHRSHVKCWLERLFKEGTCPLYIPNLGLVLAPHSLFLQASTWFLSQQSALSTADCEPTHRTALYQLLSHSLYILISPNCPRWSEACFGATLTV